MEAAYAAIGRAVFAAQLFETALIPIFEMFKMNTVSGYLEETGGHIQAGTFKTPPRNVVKALAKTGSIAPDLEARLNAYIDDRNLLIHHWYLQHGWPETDDPAGFVPIVQLANRVKASAKDLTRLLTGYMLRYSDAPDFREKVAEIFRQAHFEE